MNHCNCDNYVTRISYVIESLSYIVTRISYVTRHKNSSSSYELVTRTRHRHHMKLSCELDIIIRTRHYHMNSYIICNCKIFIFNFKCCLLVNTLSTGNGNSCLYLTKPHRLRAWLLPYKKCIKSYCPHFFFLIVRHFILNSYIE